MNDTEAMKEPNRFGDLFEDLCSFNLFLQRSGFDVLKEVLSIQVFSHNVHVLLIFVVIDNLQNVGMTCCPYYLKELNLVVIQFVIVS